ncbi:MAG: hypothetical protein RIQ93_1145 [Verrucomicrobiota bacterium]|jgi:hypothetical protein
MKLPASPSRSRPARAAWLLAAIAGLALAASAATPATQNLFNGKDLSGWEGNTAFWSVRDGAIVGQTTLEKPTKGNTFLVWKGGEVKNFELRAMFRLVANNDKNSANSGIQYRSKVVDPVNFVVAGYQADLDASGKYIGILYEEKGRGILAQAGQQVRVSADAAKPKIEVTGATTPPAEILAGIKMRDWNEYVIIANGNHLKQYINGKLTIDVSDVDEAKAAQSGILALQLHAGPPMTVSFKNIQLKTLP